MSKPQERQATADTVQDFFFCLPIIFGCPTKTSQEGDGKPYVCPRCHNAQVVEAKQRTWFELCWIPLVSVDAVDVLTA